MSDYRLQVIHVKTGKVAMGWQPGDKVELDLIDDLIARLRGKVGFWKGEVAVLGAVREAFLELLLAIKGRV